MQICKGGVFGVMMLITSTMMPAGMLIFGPLADVFSIESLLVISGSLMAFPGLWIFLNKLPERHQEEQLVAGFDPVAGD